MNGKDFFGLCLWLNRALQPKRSLSAIFRLFSIARGWPCAAGRCEPRQVRKEATVSILSGCRSKPAPLLVNCERWSVMNRKVRPLSSHSTNILTSIRVSPWVWKTAGNINKAFT